MTKKNIIFYHSKKLQFNANGSNLCRDIQSMKLDVSELGQISMETSRHVFPPQSYCISLTCIYLVSKYVVGKIKPKGSILPLPPTFFVNLICFNFPSLSSIDDSYMIHSVQLTTLRALQ